MDSPDKSGKWSDMGENVTDRDEQRDVAKLLHIRKLATDPTLADKPLTVYQSVHLRRGGRSCWSWRGRGLVWANVSDRTHTLASDGG